MTTQTNPCRCTIELDCEWCTYGEDMKTVETKVTHHEPQEPVLDADGRQIKVGDMVSSVHFGTVRGPVNGLGKTYRGEPHSGAIRYAQGWDRGVNVRVVEKANEAPAPTKAIEDYTGKVDGAGVKSVMTSPKTPLDLIPPQFLEGLAEVLKHGATKYAPGNWMRGMAWETTLGGVQRHIQAFRRGEEIDPESGLPHLYHAACGIMFTAWYAHGPSAEQHKQFDNRVFKPSEVK